MSLEMSHSKAGAMFKFNDHIREMEPLKLFFCTFWVQVTPESKLITGPTHN